MELQKRINFLIETDEPQDWDEPIKEDSMNDLKRFGNRVDQLFGLQDWSGIGLNNEGTFRVVITRGRNLTHYIFLGQDNVQITMFKRIDGPRTNSMLKMTVDEAIRDFERNLP